MVRDVVVVTGSSGLIGSCVVRALAERYRVVGFDRTGDPHPPVEGECVCVDLDLENSIDAGFARVRYAYGDRLASVGISPRTTTSLENRALNTRT